MKPFKTLDEQISIITSKDLIINDEKKTKHFLLNNNYYNVINKYGAYFKNKGTDVFVTNSSFDEIMTLYFLERELRSIFMKYITKAEEHIKSIIAYHFSNIYRDDYNFLNPNNYKKEKLFDVISFTSRTHRTINKFKNKNNHPIKHYINKYNNIPLWVMVNFISFDEMCIMFSLLKDFDKLTISEYVSKFYNIEFSANLVIRPSKLETVLTNFKEFRNICAHNNRLLSFKSRGSYPFNNLLHKNQNQGLNRQSLFDTFIFLQILLTHNDYSILHNTLIKRFAFYKNKINSILFDQIYKEYGFPNNWDSTTTKMNQNKIISY